MHIASRSPRTPLERRSAMDSAPRPAPLGALFEAAMVERYHCGTTSAVNVLWDRTTWMRLSVCSPGISVSHAFVASLLHFWFGGAETEFAVVEEEAGSFKFRVASPSVAAEIALIGCWAIGPLRAIINLDSGALCVACADALHARHACPPLAALSAGATCRKMITPSARIDQTGHSGSGISSAAGRESSRGAVTAARCEFIVSSPDIVAAQITASSLLRASLFESISIAPSFDSLHRPKLTFQVEKRSEPTSCISQSRSGNDALPRCATPRGMQEPCRHAQRARSQSSNPSAISSNALPPPPPSYKDLLLCPPLPSAPTHVFDTASPEPTH
jgi:hypothetical protein